MKADTYKLLIASLTRDLNDYVCNHLRDGYELYGSPFINKDGLFYQAVILIEDEE